MGICVPSCSDKDVLSWNLNHIFRPAGHMPAMEKDRTHSRIEPFSFDTCLNLLLLRNESQVPTFRHRVKRLEDRLSIQAPPVVLVIPNNTRFGLTVQDPLECGKP